MRICIICHQYPPHPGSSLAARAEATARALAAAGHVVHVVTNTAVHHSDRLQDHVELWREGNLTVHRLNMIGWDGKPAPSLRFCELNTGQYPDHDRLWAHELSNLVAAAIAGFVRSLHTVVGFDVIEVPEQFACAYYIIRHRRAGRRSAYPPVCLSSHSSTRESLRLAGQVHELGSERMRERMLREEYCLEHADGLQAPSASLMERYEQVFGEKLPVHHGVIPHYPDAESEAMAVDASEITAKKIELFERVIAAEPEAPAADAALPGRGVIVIDVADVAPRLILPTITSVAAATVGSRAWRVALLVGDEPTDELNLPPSWSKVGAHDVLPFSGLGESDRVVWVRAGVRFEHDQLANMICLAYATPDAAGAFAWLRPPDIEFFPYPQDGGLQDFLAEGATLPAALCLRASPLAAVRSLRQLATPTARIAGLAALAMLATGSPLLHTGSVDGDFYGQHPLLTELDRQQALGLADMLGVLPRQLLTTNSRARLITKSPPQAAPAAVYEPPDMKHLREIYDEHMRLKNHRVVRMLRSLRLFAFARRVMPGAKKYLGTGHRPK